MDKVQQRALSSYNTQPLSLCVLFASLAANSDKIRSLEQPNVAHMYMLGP